MAEVTAETENTAPPFPLNTDLMYKSYMTGIVAGKRSDYIRWTTRALDLQITHKMLQEEKFTDHERLLLSTREQNCAASLLELSKPFVSNTNSLPANAQDQLATWVLNGNSEKWLRPMHEQMEEGRYLVLDLKGKIKVISTTLDHVKPDDKSFGEARERLNERKLRLEEALRNLV